MKILPHVTNSILSLSLQQFLSTSQSNPGFVFDRLSMCVCVKLYLSFSANGGFGTVSAPSCSACCAQHGVI